LLLLAFGFQALYFATEVLFALAEGGAVTLKIAQLRVQTVEKLADVLRLCGQAFAGRVSDLLVQSQALRNVDAR
jgi:hypothetical protein